jgi:hypothetical protein
MAVQRLSKEIKRAALLELAQKADLDVLASAQIIERMRGVAEQFATFCAVIPHSSGHDP